MATRKYLTPEQLRQAATSSQRRGVVDLTAANTPASQRPANVVQPQPQKAKAEPPTTTCIPSNAEAAVTQPDNVAPPAPTPPTPPAPRLPRERTRIINEEEFAKIPTSDTTLEEEKTTVLGGIPKIPTASTAYTPTPPVKLGKNALDYIDLHMQTLPIYMNRKLDDRLMRLNDGVEYLTGDIVAKGAECILYSGRLDNDIFCVKSIRSWLDKFLGNPRTRNDKGKLSKISYGTKVRHITNEYQIATMLQEDDASSQIPVRVYGLRRVSKCGLELGWDLLMERIYGIDLSDKGLLKALSTHEKLCICILICQAIDILHQRHIIHLDIKPSNFLLERNGRVRLIDFGISVQSGSRNKGVAGTAGYFSPEQIARGELSEVTDIFALGITFSIIFGAKPLSQNAKDALNKSQRHEASTSLKASGSAISDIPELERLKPLADVIRACSSYKRENRPASCRAIVRQLRSAAAKCGIVVP